MIEYRIDDSNLQRRLVRMLKDLKAPGIALDDAGAQITEQLRRGFTTATDPWGEPWKALKNPSKRRGRNAKPLRDTGALMKSLTFDADNTGLDIGTNLAYSVFHQFGTKNIPSRRFLPIQSNRPMPAKIERTLTDTLMAHLRR